MAAPNLNAVLAALLKQVQAAENAMQQVVLSRIIGFATGAQLDMIGRIVGEDRLGVADDAYRAAIRLRIYINSSSGTPEDVINIARLMTGQSVVQYIDITPGNFRLVISGWTLDDGTLLTNLQKVCGGGVRLLGVHHTYPLRRFQMGDTVGQNLLHE